MPSRDFFGNRRCQAAQDQVRCRLFSARSFALMAWSVEYGVMSDGRQAKAGLRVSRQTQNG
jgi:hypothetical protein